MPTLVDAFFERAKLNVYENVDIHTNIDSTHFCLQQQGYATYFDVKGAKESLGDEELQKHISLIVSRMRKLLNSGGYGIEVSLTRDPDRSEIAVRKALRPAMESARTTGLNMDFLFEDKIRALAKHVAEERGLLCFKTSIYALDEVARKREQAKLGTRKFDFIARYGARPDAAAGEALLSLHKTSVSFFVRTMSSLFVLETLSVRNALRRLRQEIAPESTPDTWEPRVWSEQHIALGKMNRDFSSEDMSPLLPPAFGLQLFPDKPFLSDDPTIFRSGTRYIAPMTFHLLPQYPTRFSSLFDSLSARIPFRLTMSAETGGILQRSRLATKKNLAAILSFLDSKNKDIAASAKAMLDRIESEKVPLLLVRASICTWGATLEEAQERKLQIINEVSAWGGPELRSVPLFTWDPWMESIPGITMSKASTGCPYFADDLLSILPLDRPAEAWSEGGFLLRSEDGKLLPIESFSASQQTWNALTFAGPGSGKTVMALARKLSEVVAAGNSEVPYQTLLDIGFSTEGYIELLQAILPPDKKDLALMVNMELSKKTLINPWDTALGCDMPLTSEMDFVVNFMRTLVMNAESETPEVLSDAAAMLARRMYEYYFENPIPYQQGTDARIDRILAESDFDLPTEPYWREIRDELFRANRIQEAGRAHRLAIPNLTLATSVINNDEIFKSSYATTKTPSGEEVIEMLRRKVAEAVSNYPNIAGASTFDFGRARIIAFNLRAVANVQSPQGIKQTALMYSVADKAASSAYFTDGDDLSSVPALYRPYHKKRFEQLQSSHKSKLYEELHVPAALTRGEVLSPVLRTIDIEMATGRKYSVAVDGVTQRLASFTPGMIENGSSYYILDASDDNKLRQLEDLFGLRKSTLDQMRTHLVGPTSAGGPVTCIHKMKRRGRIIQNGYLTLGSVELWAICSTQEDVLVRRELARRLGFEKALRLLSDRFPGGSLKEPSEYFRELLNTLDKSIAVPASREWVKVLANYILQTDKATLSGVLDKRIPLSKDLVRASLGELGAA